MGIFWTLIGKQMGLLLNVWDAILRRDLFISIPFRWTGYTQIDDMKDAFKLLDAIHSAYSHPEYAPKDGVTHCNNFVNEVCQTMGFKEFEGLLANQIADAVSKHTQWSEEKDLERCQDLANGGTLLIATFVEEPHGHVNVICPGHIKTSGRWNKVPSCANVGKENFIGKGINWAFRSMPRLWIWRPTL